MTQIIGIAGLKQSGKDTSCNYITMLKLAENGVCKNARINDQGKIEVSDIFGEKIRNKDYFPLEAPYVNVDLLYNNEVQFCKKYALADALKSFLISTFGLEYNQLYGTDEEKNSKTHLRWQNMPGCILDKDFYKTEYFKQMYDKDMVVVKIKEKLMDELGIRMVKNGFMSAREVMQFFGTEVCRSMYENVWVDTLIRKIETDKPEVALVCDVRFDNEIKMLREKKAFVVGLTRDINHKKKGPRHKSERVNIDLCNVAIRNQTKTVEETNQLLYKAIKHLPGIPNIVEE